MSTAVAEPAARLDEINERIDWLQEREREINAAIGSAMAVGEDVSGLRDERREVRDEMEDLVAAIPHVERRVEEAEVAACAAKLKEVLAVEDQRVEQAVSIGKELRRHLSAARELAEEFTTLTSDQRVAWTHIHNLARRARQRDPSAPQLFVAAGLSAPFVENHLPKIVGQIKEEEARRGGSLTNGV